ncbi:hypothetical protein CTI12_AA303710 [Artemisia annua]|uniref:Uncharacterized protein n=1 Tax=Artemisia annua TaxID=35608 RepID=A0A2U1N219_ARTAN|nr:hypothetical protein CTI12_AA303710 [Artemisia annua]
MAERLKALWFESTSKRAKGPKAGSEPDFEIQVQDFLGSRVPVPKRMGEFGLSVHRSGGSICSGVVRRGVAQSGQRICFGYRGP